MLPEKHGKEPHALNDKDHAEVATCPLPPTPRPLFPCEILLMHPASLGSGTEDNSIHLLGPRSVNEMNLFPTRPVLVLAFVQ